MSRTTEGILVSDSYEQYRESAHHFAQTVIVPLRATIDAERPLTVEELSGLRKTYAQHEIASSGPVGADGEIDPLADIILTEEMWRASGALGCLGTDLVAYPGLAQTVLSDEKRGQYPHLLGDDVLIAFGLSEPDVGSNPAGLQTVARRVEGGWRINGRKLWISHAHYADAILLFSRVVEDEQEKGLGVFLVERAAGHFTTSPIATLGLNTLGTSEVVLDDVTVPEHALVRPPGSGMSVAQSALLLARLRIAASSVGLAMSALDEAVRYATERHQFGRPIAGFQLVQALLADMAIDVEAGRLLVENAAARVAAKLPAVKETSMAKAFCTEMGARVASAGIQVHGAMGLASEGRPQEIFRDARMLTIPDGTTQIHQLVIGRELTGINALAS